MYPQHAQAHMCMFLYAHAKMCFLCEFGLLSFIFMALAWYMLMANYI